MFTIYYFEGPGYEIFPLRTRLNDIFHDTFHQILNKEEDSHWLGRIWSNLKGTKSISCNGYVSGDIRPDACHLLRNGKWVMELDVVGSHCRDLWDLMIRKWAPHCCYYYLAYGTSDLDAESNDVKHKYFSCDYAVSAQLSEKTPEELRRVFSQHTVHLRYEADKYSTLKTPYDIHYAYWQRGELRKQMLTLVPMPKKSTENLVDIVSMKLMGSQMSWAFETRIRIYQVHYLVRDNHRYFIPALEALRQNGQIH